MPNIDLHTHSIASPDGGITMQQYTRMLRTGVLDMIAITDHDTITFAVEARRALGSKIIIGEEITTTEGEIIGLFLSQQIEPMQSPEKTIAAIKGQGGIVYIPHPFETLRKGISLNTLERIADDIDIIEIYNGRVMQSSKRKQAVDWAITHGVAGAASSDAHGARGWGRAYTQLGVLPEGATITRSFHNATLVCKDVGMAGRLYPTLHRTRRRFRKHA